MSAVIMQGAIVLGDVTLGQDANIWYGAVLRGDIGSIKVGARSNIQDNCVLHVATGDSLVVGDDVTVGHACVLHGCTVGSGSFVGMGCVVMDGAVLEEDCMVGAGSLVTSGSVIPKGTLALGRPAKVVRPLTPEEIVANREHTATYAARAKDPIHKHSAPL